MKPIKTLTMFLMAFVIFALAGCGTQQTVPIYKTVVIAPDDNQMLDCVVATPPEKAVYKAATDKEKEKMLIELAEKNYKNTFLCNDRWAKLRLWKKLELEKAQKNSVKGD